MRTNRFMLGLLVMTFAFGLIANVYANPANPKKRIWTQPDGTTFMGTLKGDEHFIFGETMDGYTFKRGTDNWWYYATKQNGLLVASAFRVGVDYCPYDKNLRPDAAAVAKMPGNEMKQINVTDDQRHRLSLDFLYGPGGTKENPAKAPTGKQYVNILLSDFSDSTFKFYSNKERLGTDPYPDIVFPTGATTAQDSIANTKHFWFLIFGDTDTARVDTNGTNPKLTPDSSQIGSLTNFFRDMCYQKVYFYGQVDGPRNTAVTYGAACTAEEVQPAYALNAMSRADPYVDYDQNNDGVADPLIIIHPGHESQSTGYAEDIGSASYTGYFSYTTTTGDNAGANVTINQQIFCGQGGELGVMCHELFHRLGGPDLYDYGYSASPWDFWSLMDRGSWGAAPGQPGGHNPTFVGAHLIYDIDGLLSNGIDGWLTEGVTTDSIGGNAGSAIKHGDSMYVVAAMDSCGTARETGVSTKGIRVWRVRNDAFRDSGQLFLVENRRRNPPYESGLPEDGIIISHIDTRNTGALNDGPPGAPYFYSWVECPGYDINIHYNLFNTGVDPADTSYGRYPWDLASYAAYSANDNKRGWPEIAIDSLSRPNCLVNGAVAALAGRNGPWITDVSCEGPYMSFNASRTSKAAGTPIIGYKACEIKDPVALSGVNNNNGVMDPWETCSLKVNLLNTGTNASGITCSLFVVNANAIPYVSVTPAWKTVPDIAANATSWSSPHILSVSKDVPRLLTVVFGLAIRASGGYTDTSYFNYRVSQLSVLQTWDFYNIRVGGTAINDYIMPGALATRGDTLFVGGLNTDHMGVATRIFKVKKSGFSFPLVSADTLPGINNNGNVNCAAYTQGIDFSYDGKLWQALYDTCSERTADNTAATKKFRFPNAAWSSTPGKRIRGICLGMGPGICDTVGTDCIDGDSLLGGWQSIDMADNLPWTAERESVITYEKRNVINAATIVTQGPKWPVQDSAWVVSNGIFEGINADTATERGYNFNGRGIEYTGGMVITVEPEMSYFIIREPRTMKAIAALPAPGGADGLCAYDIALEMTDSTGTVLYRPGATNGPAYAPYTRGARYFIYVAANEEGRVYKVELTGYFRPTPCDSVKSYAVDGTHNVVKFWKANADTQHIQRYIIYRRDDANPVTAGDSIGYKLSFRSGSNVTTVDSFVDAAAKNDKAAHYYSVKPVNFQGYADWGASRISNPLSIEMSMFQCALGEGNKVLLVWATASEHGNLRWEVERSDDEGNTYHVIGQVPGGGDNPVGARYSYTDEVPGPGVYCYRLVDVSIIGARTTHEMLSVTVGAPREYALAQNYPNPAGRSGNTTIKYALKNPGQTSLKIYNVLGEEVRTLVNGKQPANYYTIPWNGRNNGGQAVTNGVYFYKLISGDFTATKKMMVLK